MSESPQNPELLRSLGQLVRGLSALFWGIPLSLVFCYPLEIGDRFRSLGHLGFVPGVLSSGLLLYGVLALRSFQPQERVWRRSLDQAAVFTMIGVGLSPFISWWGRFPKETYFEISVAVLCVNGLLFLLAFNTVIQRLTAMLPDRILRQDAEFFTMMNKWFILLVILLVAGWYVLRLQAGTGGLPSPVSEVWLWLDRNRRWLPVFLALVPIAMTMTLVWKIKEMIMAAVFESRK